MRSVSLFHLFVLSTMYVGISFDLFFHCPYACAFFDELTSKVFRKLLNTGISLLPYSGCIHGTI